MVLYTHENVDIYGRPLKLVAYLLQVQVSEQRAEILYKVIIFTKVGRNF